MKQSLKKEEYFLNVLNDLKIPSTAQVCALNSLLSGISSKFSQEEVDLIKLTLNSCKHMQKSINACLSVFKLNFQKMPLKYEYFDINVLIREILDEAGILLKYNKLKIQINAADNLVIYADKLLIAQVIENIIYNGIDIAYHNTPIRINIIDKNKEFYFEVKTNSPYIEEDILKNIFSRYKSCISLYNRCGINPGLILSKEIINAHFGKMVVKSFEDDINIFGFCLPLR